MTVSKKRKFTKSLLQEMVNISFANLSASLFIFIPRLTLSGKKNAKMSISCYF